MQPVEVGAHVTVVIEDFPSNHPAHPHSCLVIKSERSSSTWGAARLSHEHTTYISLTLLILGEELQHQPHNVDNG